MEKKPGEKKIAKKEKKMKLKIATERSVVVT